MAGLPRVEVNVWSDVACPWCWVGMLRYKKAASKFAGRAKIETKFHPYMIDPATKKEGEEYMAYNRRRWGSDGWTHSLRASGKPDGASFSDWKWWPNTFKAHQLIALADLQNKGPEAKEALFRATYEGGANVSKEETLQQIAAELGLEGAAEQLQGKELHEHVLAQDRYAKQDLDIHGVPHFVVGRGRDGSVLHGAQNSRAIEQALNKEISRLEST